MESSDRQRGCRISSPSLGLRKILPEQTVAPERFVISRPLAQLLWGESAAPPYLPDHVRLVSKPGGGGKFGPINSTILNGLVQFGIEVLRMAKAAQVSLADACP
jgi:hypothetical protein